MEITHLLVLFLLSVIIQSVMSKIGIQFNLIDSPSQRKSHVGDIPLVGGISIFISLSFFLVWMPNFFESTFIYLLLAFLLTFLGAFDDKYELSFKSRLLCQCLIAIEMIYLADIKLFFLGDIFGFGKVILSWGSVALTLLAVAGAINLFNMMDGLDGVLGGVSLITCLSLSVLFQLSDNSLMRDFCLVLSVILASFFAL